RSGDPLSLTPVAGRPIGAGSQGRRSTRMPVILRLSRRGTTNRPYYHIVATDSRHPRDGRFLEQIGVYDPLGNTSLAVDEEKAKKWLKNGATQSPVVKKLLRRAGVTAAPAAQ